MSYNINAYASVKEFIQNTGFITDFTSDRLDSYKKAIDQFGQLHPEIILTICKGWKSEHGLFLNSDKCELKEFWDILYKLDNIGSKACAS